MFASNLKGDISSGSFSFRVMKKIGEIAWVEVFNNPIIYECKPALLGTMLDITDKIKAERKYRDLFENAVIGVYRSTPDGKIIDVNPEDRLKFVRAFEITDMVSNNENR